MAKDIKEIKSIIIDTNVLFSSLIKEEGYTQAILSILLSQKDIKILVPNSIKEEISLHIHEISRKSGLPVKVIGELIGKFFKYVDAVSEEYFSEEIKDAIELVSDEYDAPFAGLALKNSPSIILTYNKKHFRAEKLNKRGVKVLTPSEFVNYLNMELKTNKRVKRKRGILKLMSGLLLMKKASRI